MARGIKTGGRDFVKGDPRAGRPPLPSDLKQARAYSKAEVQASLSRFLRMNIDELKAAVLDPRRPVIDHLVGSICVKGIKHGDHARLNFLLDRLIGKVKDEDDATLRVAAIAMQMQTLSPEQVIRLANEAIARISSEDAETVDGSQD
jgi:hypothetical protein